MALSSEQRRALVDNLTKWRRDRLVAAGKKPLFDFLLEDVDLVQAAHNAIMFGFQAYTVTWRQRPKTDDELAFELRPRPSLVWVPTLRRVDPRQVVLDSDDKT